MAPNTKTAVASAPVSANGSAAPTRSSIIFGNAIVVYVDSGLDDGAGVSDFTTLTDATGALDDAISADFVVPTGFAADFAFGTTTMQRSGPSEPVRVMRPFCSRTRRSFRT